MSKIIYVVIESWGQYEDASQRNVKGFPTKERAEDAIVEYQEADSRFWKLRDAFNEAFNKVRLANPQPRPQLTQLPKQPNGVKKSNWPQEYWDKRRAAEALNVGAVKAYEAELEVHCALLEVEAQKIFAMVGIPLDEQSRYGDAPFYHNFQNARENEYTIEELEVEE